MGNRRAPSITTLIFFTRPYTSSSVSVAVVWASVRVNLSNLCSTASISFSPRSFFPSFSASRCVTKHHDNKGIMPTQSTLFSLLYRKGDRGEQFEKKIFTKIPFTGIAVVAENHRRVQLGYSSCFNFDFRGREKWVTEDAENKNSERNGMFRLCHSGPGPQRRPQSQLVSESVDNLISPTASYLFNHLLSWEDDSSRATVIICPVRQCPVRVTHRSRSAEARCPIYLTDTDTSHTTELPWSKSHLSKEDLH